MVELTHEDCRPSFPVFTVETVLAAVFELTIIFQPELALLWKDQAVANILQLAAMINPTTYMAATLSTSIFAAVVGLLFVQTLLWAYVLSGLTKRKAVLIATLQLTRATKLLSVPFAQVLFYGWDCQSNCPNAQFLFQMVGLLMYLLLMATQFFYIKFYFNPLR